jgi:hypothetical protein
MFNEDMSHSVFGASIRRYATRITEEPYLIFEHGFFENELREAIKKNQTVIAEFSENAVVCYKPYTYTDSMYGIGVWLNYGISKVYTRYIMPKDMDEALKELSEYGGVWADKVWQFCAAVYENH